MESLRSGNVASHTPRFNGPAAGTGEHAIDPARRALYVRNRIKPQNNAQGHPMSEFDDRKRAQEKNFELTQELEFKAQARRAKLTGLWAAGLFGLAGEDAEAYAKTVLLADLEEAGEEDLFRKVRADFDARKVAQSDHQIRAKMAELLDEARRQVKAGV
jgi:hypothetical protein